MSIGSALDASLQRKLVVSRLRVSGNKADEKRCNDDECQHTEEDLLDPILASSPPVGTARFLA
jgi:hypothetical protein